MTPPGAPDVRRHIESVLRNGEELVWWAQPEPKARTRQLRQQMASAILFCVVAAGFGALSTTFGSSSAVMVLVFLLPFFMFGLWLVEKARRARKSKIIYGITDRRALIVTTGEPLDVSSFYPRDLGKVKRLERKDGSGNLILRQELKTDSEGGTTLSETGFMGIQDVRRVEHVLEDMRMGRVAEQ